MAKIQLADELNRIGQERVQTEHRLKRLGKAYVDGLYSDDDYRREKRSLEELLSGLVIPDVDSAKEAGELIEDLPALWEEATVSERRKLLLTLLDAVYVDTVDDKAIVAIRPKPAFQALLEIATTRKGRNIVLNKQDAPELIVSLGRLIRVFLVETGEGALDAIDNRLGGHPKGRPTRCVSNVS